MFGIKGDDTIKEMLVKTISEEVVKYYAVRYPVMAMGIVNPIAVFFVSKVVRVIVYHTALGVKFFAIDNKVDNQVEDHDKSKTRLNEALKNGDENEIKKAKEEYLKRLRDLVKLNNT